jgi:hypothetical protein
MYTALLQKLGERNSRHVNGTVIQIGIAINIIEDDRNGLDSQKENPEAHANACRRHIKKSYKT